MADLSITAAEVLPGTSAVKNSNYNYGATITQGKVLCVVSGVLQLADASDAGLDTVIGFALTSGASGQPGTIQTGGFVTLGASASLSTGKVYVLSGTPGGIMPIDDAVAAGTLYATVLGVAVSSSSLQIGIINTGVEYAADVT